MHVVTLRICVLFTLIQGVRGRARIQACVLLPGTFPANPLTYFLVGFYIIFLSEDSVVIRRHWKITCLKIHRNQVYRNRSQDLSKKMHSTKFYAPLFLFAFAKHLFRRRLDF